MELLIEKAIVEEAKKRLARHSQKMYFSGKYQKLFTKRTGRRAKSRTGSIPKSWGFDPHFDPRYCINHAKFISRGIWSSLQMGAYSTRPALRNAHPKPDGGVRYIDAFSVPDAALATIFIRNLRKRNAKIFSDSSFAYQEGKTPLDAVIRVKAMLKGEKIFVSQYDFSKFFDSIDHQYILEQLSKDGPFLTTGMERQIIGAVLTHSYSFNGVTETRTIGTPQGNSLSLFISNVAAHSLDSNLSRANGLFARFADDSVVVNYSYEDALRCAEAYKQFSDVSGVSINKAKSSGIRILSEEDAEMRNIDCFNFLSYKFSSNGISVGERSIRAIKARCARTIYRHLMLYPRKIRRISTRRISGRQYDWDLVTCLNELRNFVYGGCSQAQIIDYLNGTEDMSNIQGAVSYFSLVEDGSQFRELDGWLVSVLHRALRQRVSLIRTLTPFKSHRLISEAELLDGTWYGVKKVPMETTVPSFHTAWRASRKSLSRHGLGGVDAIGLGYSYQ